MNPFDLYLSCMAFAFLMGALWQIIKTPSQHFKISSTPGEVVRRRVFIGALFIGVLLYRHN